MRKELKEVIANMRSDNFGNMFLDLRSPLALKAPPLDSELVLSHWTTFNTVDLGETWAVYDMGLGYTLDLDMQEPGIVTVGVYSGDDLVHYFEVDFNTLEIRRE